jgi:phosphoribosylformylglycinamidine cyclo-ligase
MANAYTKAGVDVEAGYEVVERIKKHVKQTARLGVMSTIGSFGGCFDLSVLGVKEPVLISGTDGVGTKLKLAFKANQHDTIGIDCVAMCVNDIVSQGAEPLYFLDYIATGHNDPERLEQVVAGVAEGCLQAGAALIGGETAEMPGMYGADEYDLAGFAVGVAEKSQVLTGDKVQPGDVLIGLPSSGIHSNGFSLVRQIFFDRHELSMTSRLPELPNQTLGQALLTPTKIYVSQVLPLIKHGLLNGLGHITGGGFVENIPRMFGPDLAAKIQLGTWPILPIFDVLKLYGDLESMEMFEIFNMGIGMVLAVSPDKLARVEAHLQQAGYPMYAIGEIVVREGDQTIILEAP